MHGPHPVLAALRRRALADCGKTAKLPIAAALGSIIDLFDELHGIVADLIDGISHASVTGMLLLHRVAHRPDHLHILHGPATTLQGTRRLDASRHQEEAQDQCAAHGGTGAALEFSKSTAEFEPLCEEDDIDGSVILTKTNALRNYLTYAPGT